MKSNLMKKTLTVLALGSLGLLATGAQADGNRGGYGSGPGYNTSYGQIQERVQDRDHRRYDRKAFLQSERFTQQVNARQERQMDRIQHGMRNGALTRFEFRGLMQEQRDIRAMEQHFRADGFLDAREFQRLDRALDIASQNIRSVKHDRQERHAFAPNPWYWSR
ncbi:MAG: hypothetical protein R6W97_04860 [Thiobacillus sp.]